MIFHPPVIEKLHQVVFGCLLGHGCAVLPKKSKNYHIKITNNSYSPHFEYKKYLLDAISRNKSEKKIWTSKSSEQVTALAKIIYKDGRKTIPEHLLEQMSGLSYSIFLLDRSKFYNFHMHTYMTTFDDNSINCFINFCTSIGMKPQLIKIGNSKVLNFSNNDYAYWAQVIISNMPNYAQKMLLINLEVV